MCWWAGLIERADLGSVGADGGGNADRTPSTCLQGILGCVCPLYGLDNWVRAKKWDTHKHAHTQYTTGAEHKNT